MNDAGVDDRCDKGSRSLKGYVTNFEWDVGLLDKVHGEWVENGVFASSVKRIVMHFKRIYFCSINKSIGIDKQYPYR